MGVPVIIKKRNKKFSFNSIKKRILVEFNENCKNLFWHEIPKNTFIELSLILSLHNFYRAINLETNHKIYFPILSRNQLGK
jgi:cytochrome c oxidase assembly protein Cox11